jgi:hypothetical protein
MTAIEPRVQAVLDAATTLVRNAAASAAMRALENLSTSAQAATRIIERDQLVTAMNELRRNLGTFQGRFHETLREKVTKDVAPRHDEKRKLESADWQTLSLVENHEVEERMNYVRLGQLISHECEWQLRDLAPYMGSLLGLGRADDDRNPLRAEIIGAALSGGIDAISADPDSRRILSRELGQSLAKAMPDCYAEVMRLLVDKGVRPVDLRVRSVEGPGYLLGNADSGYAALPRDGRHSSRGGYDDFGPSGQDSIRDLGNNLLAAHRRAFGPSGRHVLDGEPGAAVERPGSGHTAGPPRSRRESAAADEQLMTLLRRLTSSVAAEPTAADLLGGPPTQRAGTLAAAGGAGRRPSDTGRGAGPAFRPSGGAPTTSDRGGAYGEPLTGLMAVNLIRAHREELIQASTGKLDHMVIDVVGSLFDQILSDARVPPQMAREIARLQLPVLRVALNDQTFFSTRRHPVRRFVNRIASLACAFDDFEEGPGRQFLDRVRGLVDEIVQGDFDQVEVYASKVMALERFIADQGEGEVERTGAVSTLETKESELRVQQRYMQQLQAELAPLQLPAYLHAFLTQVWSQAVVLADRQAGSNPDRARRFRRLGVDLVMSVQPKGSPVWRKKFLMQLPQLMKDLNDGMSLIGLPGQAQKEFFGQLLPAHAESLKKEPLSELDHNLLVKQLETIFATEVPPAEPTFGRAPAGAAAVDPKVVERQFTPEEAQKVGLVPEDAVDWSEPVEVAAADGVDIDIGGEPDSATQQPPLPASDSVASDLAGQLLPAVEQLAPTTSESGEPGQPIKGPQLIDHIKLGFAYQMHLKDEWQKVRLAHVSSGRTFFVFTRGGKHQETISMTARMLARMCETGRLRAVESAYLMERATQRARKQLAELTSTATVH